MTDRRLVLDIETVPDPAALMAVGQTVRSAQGRVWLHRLAGVSLFGFAETGEGHFGDFSLQSLLAAPDQCPQFLGEIEVLRAIETTITTLGERGATDYFQWTAA